MEPPSSRFIARSRRLTTLRSYAFLDNDKWWCRCSVALDNEDPIAEEALQEEMSRRDGFNEEAVGDEEFDDLLRIARAGHIDCLRFPTVFRRYWKVDEHGYDSDEGQDEDDVPEAGEQRNGAHRQAYMAC